MEYFDLHTCMHACIHTYMMFPDIEIPIFGLSQSCLMLDTRRGACHGGCGRAHGHDVRLHGLHRLRHGEWHGWRLSGQAGSGPFIGSKNGGWDPKNYGYFDMNRISGWNKWMEWATLFSDKPICHIYRITNF